MTRHLDSGQNTSVSEMALSDLEAVCTELAVMSAQVCAVRRDEVFGPVGDVKRHSGDLGTDRVSSKSTETDPVTVVDTEIEQMLRREIGERFPDDQILGEEQGGSGDVAGRRWVLDPIDGTVNFLYGIPAYAVSVAVQVNGTSVAGAVADVARGVVYSAARGAGARARGADGSVVNLSCSTVTNPQLALLATGFGYSANRRRRQGDIVRSLLPQVRDIRRIGSAALDLCMVASGQVDAHIEHGLSPWDWAAGSLIATEAGAFAVLPEPDSCSSDGQATIAVAPNLAEPMMQVFSECGALDPIPS